MEGGAEEEGSLKGREVMKKTKEEGVVVDEGMGVERRRYWRGQRKKDWREERRRKGYLKGRLGMKEGVGGGGGIGVWRRKEGREGAL